MTRNTDRSGSGELWNLLTTNKTFYASALATSLVVMGVLAFLVDLHPVIACLIGFALLGGTITFHYFWHERGLKYLAAEIVDGIRQFLQDHIGLVIGLGSAAWITTVLILTNTIDQINWFAGLLIGIGAPVIALIALLARTKDDPEPQVSELSPGETVEIVPRPKGRQPQSKRRVVDDLKGQKYLVVERWEKMGRWKLGNLNPFKKQELRHITNALKIHDSVLIDEAVLCRKGFFPTKNETDIYCYMRRSWWSHGILQGLLALFGGAGFVVGYTAKLNPLLLLGWLALGGLVYATVRMLWNRTYVMTTNQRLIYRFDPVAIIPGFFHDIPLGRLLGMTFDEGLIGKTLRFATVKSETAANKTDKWIADGVRFITHYNELVTLLSGFISQFSNTATPTGQRNGSF